MIVDQDEPLRGKKSAAARRQIIELIDNELSPHNRLPGERELSGRLGITRPTLRVVLAQLEREDRVYRIHGSGTYVAPPKIAKELELTSFTEDMLLRGLKPGARALAKEMMPAGPDIGGALQIGSTDMVLHVRRLRTANQEPMCLEDVYLPGDKFGRRLIKRPLSGSLYEVLQRDFGIELVYAEQTMRATTLKKDEAAILGANTGFPALEVIRVAYDQRRQPIERTRSLYRGDRYTYSIAIQRN